MEEGGPTGGLRFFTVTSLLFVSVLTQVFSSDVNEIVTTTIEATDEEENNIIGLNNVEEWPVIRVEFPNRPFPNSLLKGIFEGDNSAGDYIAQISGGSSSLNITILEETWSSPFPDSYWGTDSFEKRDVGSGSGGAQELASETINSILIGKDLSLWDLDNNLVIDRLLIIHSGQPQEQGGPSSAIWSHFSPFQDRIVIGKYTIEHYTMASIYGGLGVVMHEMMHQMGAVDLYDVHSDSPTKNWHGLGDWDIMASGNWIDDGDMPSLPSSSTLNLIGAVEPMILSGLYDMNYTIMPVSIGGSPLMIEIADGEYVWISLRADLGFDRGLPGHGVLVEHQDSSFGDLDSNLVNTDPSRPWTKIIEADGNNGLIRGIDYGSNGDVFTEGNRFGNTAIQIWDNRGRLVPWTISITSINNDSAEIFFDYAGDTELTVYTPRNPIVLLRDELEYVDVFYDSQEPCDLFVEFQDHVIEIQESNSTYFRIIILNGSKELHNSGTLSGRIGCDGDLGFMTHISLDWVIINHRLSSNQLDATVPWDSDSVASLYPESEGSGPRIYSISVDGPAGRVSNPITSGEYFPGDPILLQINPDGLLEPRMIARGELVIVDSDNIEQRIPIVLTSEGELPFGILNWVAIPANAISLILILISISIANPSGFFSNPKKD